MNYWTPLNYEGFEQYLIKKSTHKYWGGFQYEFQFDNGFGASVIKHDETVIADNVIGWLTNEEVIDYLKAIQLL